MVVKILRNVNAENLNIDAKIEAICAELGILPPA